MLPSAQEIIGFVEIAKHRNITKAAQAIGITQPSMSLALRRLEESIGEALVIRSKNGVELTTAGREFLKHATILLNKWQDAVTQTKLSTHEVQGNVKLGCHPAVGLYTLDQFLPKLVRNHPKLEITLVHDLSRKICQLVQNFDLDIGLVINPVQHPDLVMTKVLTDEVRLWTKQGANEDVLICHPDLLQTQDILKKLKKSKHTFRRTITSDSLENITKLAVAGVGQAIIPSRVIDIYDVKKKLMPSFEKGPVFKDELYVIYRVENKDTAFIKEVKKEIIASLSP